MFTNTKKSFRHKKIFMLRKTLCNSVRLASVLREATIHTKCAQRNNIVKQFN